MWYHSGRYCWSQQHHDDRGERAHKGNWNSKGNWSILSKHSFPDHAGIYFHHDIDRDKSVIVSLLSTCISLTSAVTRKDVLGVGTMPIMVLGNLWMGNETHLV